MLGRPVRPDAADNERAASGGFFSSASRLPLLPGSQIAHEGLRGYYIDLTMKAREPRWPPDWLAPGALYVEITQWGLGALDRYYADEGSAWRDAAIACGRENTPCCEPANRPIARSLDSLSRWIPPRLPMGQ